MAFRSTVIAQRMPVLVTNREMITMSAIVPRLTVVIATRTV